MSDRTLSTNHDARDDYRELTRQPIKRGFWAQLKYNRYVKKKPYLPNPHIHLCFDCEGITEVSCTLPCRSVYFRKLSDEYYRSEFFREECGDCSWGY